MTSLLASLLLADPRDPGCDAGILTLAHYAELEAAGEDAAARYPGQAVHLRACEACRSDHDALLAYLREEMA